MTARALLKLIAAYVLVVLCAAALVRVVYGVDPTHAPTGRTVVSVWRQGERVARAATDSEPGRVLEAEATVAGSTVVYERILDEAPAPTLSRALFCMAFASGRDGVRARFGGKEAFVTADDLIKHQAYGVLSRIGPFPLRCGLSTERALELLASELGTSPAELWTSGELSRVVLQRSVRNAKQVLRAPITVQRMTESVLAAATYLASNLQEDGTFRYEVDVTKNEDIPGYNWPRHSGATLFLAEAATRFRGRLLLSAARRAARRLREHATLDCGKYRCIGEGERVDLGSSALALLAYVQLVEGDIDNSFKASALELTEFIRSLQRADGEFKHLFHRDKGEAEDVQLPYYTGEAAYALSRVHRISGNPKDLEAAKKALDFTANRRWTFFGSRYYWDSEHWTCQALGDLWDRSQDRGALDFCLRWHRFNRAVQFDSSNRLGDYDGAFTVDPTAPPRLTPAASRTEGAAGTLEVAAKAGVAASEIEALEEQIDRAIQFLLRHQFAPGPAHLFPNPALTYGGFPGSPIDYKVRIDFPQHAGSAMLRHIRYLEAKQLSTPSLP
jgi:hypothetical protein